MNVYGLIHMMLLISFKSNTKEGHIYKYFPGIKIIGDGQWIHGFIILCFLHMCVVETSNDKKESITEPSLILLTSGPANNPEKSC